MKDLSKYAELIAGRLTGIMKVAIVVRISYHSIQIDIIDDKGQSRKGEVNLYFSEDNPPKLEGVAVSGYTRSVQNKYQIAELSLAAKFMENKLTSIVRDMAHLIQKLRGEEYK